MTNQTPNSKIEAILADYGSARAQAYKDLGDGAAYSVEAEKLKAEAATQLQQLMIEERIDELEQRIPRLQRLIKSNADVGTGSDIGSYNTAIKWSLRADDNRKAELQAQLNKEMDNG